VQEEHVHYDKLALIVEQAKKGDDEAFALLFNEFSKSIYYIALRITKSEHDAHDVVQETMITLYKNLSSIRDVKATVAYVNKITSRQAVRILRNKNNRLMEEDADEISHLLTDDNEDFIPEEYVTKKELREHIINLIDKLNDIQRTVIILYYYKQLSIKQISETLEIDEAAVKMRLSRARAVLREKVNKSTYLLIQGVIPMTVLNRILEINADEVYTSDVCSKLWVEFAETLGITVSAVTVVTASSAVTAKAVPTIKTTISSIITTAKSTLLTIVITSVATTAIAICLWITGVINLSEETTQPTEATSHITFTGGPYEEFPNVNPTHAAVTSENIHGELQPHHWWIVSMIDEKQISSGKGGTVDAELVNMITNHKYGEYILYFSKGDAAGNTYEIYRQFIIRSVP